jgi:hypothetical protein
MIIVHWYLGEILHELLLLLRVILPARPAESIFNPRKETDRLPKE